MLGRLSLIAHPGSQVAGEDGHDEEDNQVEEISRAGHG
jgi:hypothetical protein